MKERSLPSGGEPFQFEFGRIERTAGRREIGSFKFVPSRLGARFARICELPPDDRFGGPPNRAGMRYGAPRRSFSNRAWIGRPHVGQLFDHALDQQPVETLEAGGVYGCVQLRRHLRQREIERIFVGGKSPRRPTLDARSDAPCGGARHAYGWVVPFGLDEFAPFGKYARRASWGRPISRPATEARRFLSRPPAKRLRRRPGFPPRRRRACSPPRGAAD